MKNSAQFIKMNKIAFNAVSLTINLPFVCVLFKKQEDIIKDKEPNNITERLKFCRQSQNGFS